LSARDGTKAPQVNTESQTGYAAVDAIKPSILWVTSRPLAKSSSWPLIRKPFRLIQRVGLVAD